MKISQLPKKVRKKAKRNGASSDILVYAFEWARTPEGYDYWDKWNSNIVVGSEVYIRDKSQQYPTYTDAFKFLRFRSTEERYIKDDTKSFEVVAILRNPYSGKKMCHIRNESEEILINKKGLWS